MSTGDYYSHMQKLAFELNVDLPESYQAEIYEEELRVLREVLGNDEGRSRKVLLLGGAGYIGPIVSQGLLERGYSVRCLDNLIYSTHQAVAHLLSHPRYEFQNYDLVLDNGENDVLEGITDVVILAGLVGDPITKKYPEESEAINDKGIGQFIRSLNGRGLNKVLFISTCSNYGLIGEDETADELFKVNPLSLYAKAKVKNEQLLIGLRDSVDYSATVLRFSTAFGHAPRMRFDLTVNEFTRELALGRDLLVFDADTWRPYCHVSDFSQMIARVLEAPIDRVAFEIFNAGGDSNNFTKRMVIEEIQKIIPDTNVTWQEQGPDPRNYRVNFSKVRSILHFEPAYSVADGVREVVEAISNGFFHDCEGLGNFHGNYTIDRSY